MQVSKNFDIREFVPKSLWIEKGKACLWYVSPTVISLAQFSKDFFSDYFQEEVNIIVNDWLWGGSYHERGWRYPNTETGSKLSFHKGGLCTAYDYEVYRKEADIEINPKRIHTIILKHEKEFMAAGLTTLESKKFAPGWTHSDHRNTGLDYILVVGDPRPTN